MQAKQFMSFFKVSLVGIWSMIVAFSGYSHSFILFIAYLAVKSMHNPKQIKMFFSQSETIIISITKYIFTSDWYNFFIASDFSIRLMQLTSKVQTPITFLIVNKNTKCW